MKLTRQVCNHSIYLWFFKSEQIYSSWVSTAAAWACFWFFISSSSSSRLCSWVSFSFSVKITEQVQWQCWKVKTNAVFTHIQHLCLEKSVRRCLPAANSWLFVFSALFNSSGSLSGVWVMILRTRLSTINKQSHIWIFSQELWREFNTNAYKDIVQILVLVYQLMKLVFKSHPAETWVSKCLTTARGFSQKTSRCTIKQYRSFRCLSLRSWISYLYCSSSSSLFLFSCNCLKHTHRYKHKIQ